MPIPAGERVIGVVALESERQHAFSDADERLLSTLAASMGVALENARLFEETKRLLAETDERAAELALINSVQEGLSANLDMQSMYDLVGNKIQEIFDAQVVTIGIYDLENDLVRFPFTLERGGAFPIRPSRSSGTAGRYSRRARSSSSTTWTNGSGSGARSSRSSRARNRSRCSSRH